MSTPPTAPTDPRPTSVSTEWLVGRHGRPLFVFAHQDDESVCAGLIHRVCGDDGRGTFLWWTNGDGLAPWAKMDPAAYGALRMAESAEALRCLGISASRKVDLECSEILNYRLFTHVARGGTQRAEALAHFRREADRVEQAVRAADPDRVFVLAYQGGHPEHDLSHVMTARAVRRLRAETGRPIPLVQVPAYEYIVLNPMRFKPWFKGDRRRLRLTPDELQAKLRLMGAYPTQGELIKQFRAVISTIGLVSALRLKPFTAQRFLADEELGVVEPDHDYTRSTHRFERLNYVNDDFEGEPIRFDAMIAPVAAAILQG
jgi:LmbE family N-acetylglucosaminyl deacetylase